MSVAQSKQILSTGMRKDHQALLSPSSHICSDYPGTLETVSSSCVLLGARLQLIPILEPEMGTISHLIPLGPDRGPDHLPESHYLISERFTQRLQGGQRFIVSVQ